MATYCVAVTGGVASGKSEVTRRFERLGIAVADADVAARSAVAVGTPGLAEVVAAFGQGVLEPDGALNRSAMRERVFADPAARRTLEQIVHPRVRSLLQTQWQYASGPYAVVAIPLLAEGGGRASYPWIDRIVVVDAPLEAQRARLMQRDGSSVALADHMIAAQATRAARLAIADDVIVNAGGLDAIDDHVVALDRRYRLLVAHKSVADVAS
ncbi:dephospho-CoA kinase [Lysobacter korlensis]|uniref:Dephospho-CoA kinase n=1 Tax=Lysobacter korlensis TaxID=553636 RepID=A0ABV6RIZ6_9GAMM